MTALHRQTTTCLPLPYQAHYGVVVWDERRVREQSVEKLIQLAHDYDEPKFYELLLVLRPDLDNDTIERGVDELIGLSLAAEDARTFLDPVAAQCAVDDYQSVLRRFAQVPS